MGNKKGKGKSKRKYPNYKITDKFIKSHSLSNASIWSTNENYRNRVNRFLYTVITHFDLTDVREITQDTIIKYFKHLGSIDKSSPGYMKNADSICKTFITWLIVEGYLPKDFLYPKVHFEKIDKLPKYIPTPDEIFAVRSQRYARIEHAMLFEILLSSGIRRTEALQIRAEDLDFNDKAIDVSTGMQSRYCGGSIKIYINRMRIKGKYSRKVYFSVLCGRLLRKFMEINGIPFKSEIPIFPIGVRTSHDWIKVITNGMVDKDNQLTLQSSTNRKQGLTDVNLEKYDGLDPELVKAIKKRKFHGKNNKAIQNADKGSISDNVIKAMNETTKRTYMNPHCFRHLFACTMYSRTYEGTINDIVRLRYYLGHLKDEMYLNYITRLNIIRDSSDWTRLMMGRSMDWNDMIYSSNKRSVE